MKLILIMLPSFVITFFFNLPMEKEENDLEKKTGK